MAIGKLLNRIRYCNCCGAKILLYGYDPLNRITRMMEQKSLCYDCAFWQDIIDYPPEYIEIIGNKCLKIYPVADRKDKTLILGGKGKMRYFIRKDWFPFQSNDIWIIGTIPKHFRDKLKPTVIEITAKAYNQLKRTNKKCNARACFDRYHCFRYDKEKNEDNEPYNSAPPKWKVGNEHCRYFINKQEILCDESSVV